MQSLIVLTTLPDPDSARQLARQLVEARLAACANVLAPCTSVYRWNGVVQEDTETTLMIKTTVARYPDLETYLRERHPYELPEILALPIHQGLPDYLQWVSAETRA
jgi:periplasmic divalent cation tolerance protein